MQLLRLAVLIGLVLFGGAGALIGAVMTLSALAHGLVMLTYVVNGTEVTETVHRAVDPGRFWQLLGLVGALPLVLGASAVWLGMRWLRR